jgi:acid phosphatase (class A)
MNLPPSGHRRRWALVALATTTMAAGAAAETPYLTRGEVDLTRFLVAPPAVDSAAQRVDLDAVLDIQRKRSREEIGEAQADQEVSVFRFADVLGKTFAEERLPKTAALARKACQEASRLTAAAKRFWKRPRPYVTSREVTPVTSNLSEGSYPSGHATCGYLWAILLADMIPERRDALLARGVRYGHNRVVGGVHYPTDVEAGRLSAAVIAAVMARSPVFRTDFAAARAELRGALGYPAAAASLH